MTNNTWKGEIYQKLILEQQELNQIACTKCLMKEFNSSYEFAQHVWEAIFNKYQEEFLSKNQFYELLSYADQKLKEQQEIDISCPNSEQSSPQQEEHILCNEKNDYITPAPDAINIIQTPRLNATSINKSNSNNALMTSRFNFESMINDLKDLSLHSSSENKQQQNQIMETNQNFSFGPNEMQDVQNNFKSAIFYKQFPSLKKNTIQKISIQKYQIQSQSLIDLQFPFITFVISTEFCLKNEPASVKRRFKDFQ